MRNLKQCLKIWVDEESTFRYLGYCSLKDPDFDHLKDIFIYLVKGKLK